MGGLADPPELLAVGDELMRTTGVQRVSGLETWSELPGRTEPAPPRWKMFLASVIGIYSLQVLLNYVLGPVMGDWLIPTRVAVISVGVTALMIWLVMLSLARLLQSWLCAAPHRRTG